MTRRAITARGRVTGADPAARTITGRLLVYGREVGLGPWGDTFELAPGCAAGTRPVDVKLLVDHDHDRPAGVAAALSDSDTDLRVTFRVARTPTGDLALLEAAEGVRDGLSMGGYIDRSTLERRDGREVEVVTALELYEGSLVTFPAFTDARVTEVTGEDRA